ncbi:hypothetical protein AA979_00570 [Stenotrophomonas maltophilia]|nr:hypothetical protein AA979_00570 [Stenotrophomonas maltophilia]
MFRREVKSPPITPLAMSKRVELAALDGATTWPANRLACTAPGWSIRNTRGPFGSATSVAAFTCGASPVAFQSPSCLSSSGTISARVVSPTTIRVPFCGRAESW